MKKDSASGMSDIIETLIITVLLSFLMVLVVSYGNQLYTYTRIESVSRRYIQQMETTGYLTTQLRNDLVNELTDIGVVNIDCSDSTVTKTPNGENISLTIKADYQYDVFQYNFFVSKTSKTHTFNIVRESISKCYE